jgi:hypothetical protein
MAMMRTALAAIAVSGGIACAVIAGCSPASVGDAPLAVREAGPEAPDEPPHEAGANLDAATTATDAGDAGINVSSVCADQAYARCTRLQGCSSTALQIRFGDVRACEAVFQAICTNNLTAASTGATTATVELCAKAVPDWGCTDYVFNLNAPPACQVQTGALANGAPCGVNSQCQTGFCAIAPGKECGSCASVPAAGDSCAQLVTCGTTLACSAVTQKCITFAQIGDPCSNAQPCADGLTCVGFSAQAGTTGTCKTATSTSGAACDFLGAGCNQFAGLSCNAQTQLCDTAQVVAAGSACGLVANRMAYCAASGTCTAGACVAASALGGPCDLANGLGCIDNTRCIVSADGGTAGTCQVPSAISCH